MDSPINGGSTSFEVSAGSPSASSSSPSSPSSSSAKVSLGRELMSNLPLLLVCSFAAIGGFMFGYDIGCIGGVTTMNGFRDVFSLPRLIEGTPDDSHTASIVGWIVSSLTAGCLVGSAVGGPLAENLGRRLVIMLGALLFTVGGVLQSVSSSLPLLFIGRVVAGVAIGALSLVVPMYNSEVAPPNLRGALGTLQQLLITFGILVAFVVNIPLNSPSYGWRLSLGVQPLLGVILFVGMIFLPDSPSFFMTKGREEDARKVLLRLRVVKPFTSHSDTNWEDIVRRATSHSVSLASSVANDAVVKSRRTEKKGEFDISVIEESSRSKFADPKIQTNVDFELEALRQEVELFKQMGSTTWKDVFSPEARSRLVIGCVLQMFQQLTGVNAIMYYAPVIFSAMHIDPLIGTAIPGVVNFASTIVATSFIDSAGRVPLLLIGGWGMFVTSLFVGITVVAAQTNPTTSYWVLILICVFIMNFAYSWGPITWIVPSEIFPLSVRGKCLSLTTGMNWVSNFVISLVTPVWISFSLGFTFFLFAIFLFAMVVFVWACVPETAGIPLDKMDSIFSLSTESTLKFIKMNVSKRMVLFRLKSETDETQKLHEGNAKSDADSI